MKFLVKAILTLVLALHSLASLAVPQTHAMPSSRVLNTYAVSGILRSNAGGVVIKLVQGIHVATSKDEAVGTFSREVLALYPGYSLMDTVVTPVPVTKSPCRQSV